MEEYFIVLDTNIVHIQDREDISKIFSAEATNIRKFIEENELKNVQACFPEMVIKERIHQRVIEFLDVQEKLNTCVKSMNGINKNVVKSLLKEEEIQKELEDKAQKFVSDNKFRIIQNPPLGEDLIERAVKRIKPFRDKDVGFKDTIIWLSILNDAKNKNNKNYILLSENTRDFEESSLIKQFKEVSKKKFKLCKNLGELKEYLDNELTLSLNIKDTIINLKEKLIRQMEVIKERIVREKYYYQEPYHYTILPYEDIIQDFELNTMEIENLTPKLNGDFILEIKLDITPKKETKNNIFYPNLESNSYNITQWQLNYRRGIIRVQLVYSTSEDKISKIEKISAESPIIKKNILPFFSRDSSLGSYYTNH